jgi:ADP-ribosylglycohydrolase
MSQAQHLPDHPARLERARLSLEGLSVGDAFGSQFFLAPVYERHFHARTAPPPPWRYTDDTEMALGIFEVLEAFGSVEQDELARVFARRYHADAYRGYGPAMHGLLTDVRLGTPWRDAAPSLFGGEGSLGNGSAMRVAVVGAYFADDPDRAAREACASAEVTHAHPEARAGAVAVAVAAAYAWAARGRPSAGAGGELLRASLAHTPPGLTRDGIELALSLPADVTIERAARVLGNGSRVTCPDTVPFTLWCADRHLGDYPAALWATVTAGGDVDTTCAIVGGVVALSAGGVPPDWVAAREPLDFRAG